MSSKWSGGYEYNLTTESEFEEMKQQNAILKQENAALKQSLNDLIHINNQLTDSLEQINGSILTQNTTQQNEQIQRLKRVVEHLTSQLQQRENGQSNPEIIETIEKLIESFNEMQGVFETEIEELYRKLEEKQYEEDERMKKMEQHYIKNLKDSQELLLFLRKKEEIRKVMEKRSNNLGDNLPKIRSGNRNFRHQMDTVSENKNSNSKNEHTFYQMEINELRNKQKELQSQINQKNKVILAYNQLLNKLRKKLKEKY